MPNAVIGFDARGQMWMDQGVDVRASDASATRGIDGWGSMCSGLGNLILASAEEAESRFPVLNWGRELTTDTGGAGRFRGQCGTRNVKQVLEPVTAMAWMVSRTPSAARPARRRRRGPLLQSLPGRHARRGRDRRHGGRAAAGRRDHVVPVRRRRRLRVAAAARPRSRARRRARRVRQRRSCARRATASCCAVRRTTAISPSTSKRRARCAHGWPRRDEPARRHRHRRHLHGLRAAARRRGRAREDALDARRPVARRDDGTREARRARRRRAARLPRASSTRSCTRPRSATTR